MSTRKVFGVLNLITWVTVAVLFTIANQTAIPSGESFAPSPAIMTATIFTMLFMAFSATNTILMFSGNTSGPFSSIAGPAIIFFGLTIAVMFFTASLNVNPGSTSQLFKSNVVDYIIVCLVAGAILDVCDLFIVNHKES